MNVTATSTTWSTVTAALTNGSTLEAQFVGGTPAVLSALTRQLSLAAGATFTWTVQALVENNGVPLSGQTVTWQNPTAGIAVPSPASVTTNSAGIATQTLSVGPLAEGQTASIIACLNGTNQCVAFTAFGARPEYAALEAISGTSQNLAASGTPNQIALRLLDMDGNPMAGGTVALYQAALRVDAALLAQHGLPAGSTTGDASLHGHHGRRWLGHFRARFAPRRGDESHGPRRLGKHLDGECFDRAASLRQGARRRVKE